jgi:hypothetical protein
MLVERVARALVWLWRLTKAWLPRVLSVAATVFGIVWGAYGGQIWSDGRWALIVAILLAILSVIAEAFLQRPSYMKLRQLQEDAERESRRKSVAIEQSLTILLRKLAEHCGIATNNDRISVYYFHDGQFVMPARYSIHPVYGGSRRKFYPIGQGAIWDAWDKGSVVTRLPATREIWEQRLVSNHGFSQAEASAMGMQCRSIGGIRIMHEHHGVGVLILESLDPEGVTQSTLNTAGSSMIYAALAELIAGQAVMTPRVEEVVKEAELKKRTPPWKTLEPRKTFGPEERR